MKTMHEKLSDVETEISNLIIFINQCMEKLPVKIAGKNCRIPGIAERIVY